MVSTEELRKYPFFGFLNHQQLVEVAMITEEFEITADTVLFAMGETARSLYFLCSGSIDLHYVVVDENLPELAKDFHVGTINPGEMMGISALIPPHEMTTTSVASTTCKLLKINAGALKKMCESDYRFAYELEKQLARTTKERLHATRILLAAATS